MSTVAPEVQEAHDLLQGRLVTLEQEKAQVEQALQALPVNGSRPTRRVGRPRAKAATAPRTTKTGRKRRSGTRADQAVALVTKKPGISASDIAKQMKIKPNYLYRVMGELEKEKRVRKDGRNYFPL